MEEKRLNLLEVIESRLKEYQILVDDQDKKAELNSLRTVVRGYNDLVKMMVARNPFPEGDEKHKIWKTGYKICLREYVVMREKDII